MSSSQGLGGPGNATRVSRTSGGYQERGLSIQEETALRRAAARRAAATVGQAHANSALPGGGSSGGSVEDIFAALSGAGMAQNEFAPQYDLLNNLRHQAEDRYGRAGKEVGGMYDSLSKAIRGQEGGIKQNYNQAGSAIGSAYNHAIDETNNSFSDSRNQIADLAKRLGIQAGLPSALSDGAEQQGRLAGLMASNAQNFQGVNTMLGNNEVDYNRQSAETAGLAGVNARSDFKARLMDALNGFDNKQLEIQGEQAAAGNKYDLSIAEMKQKAEEAKAKLAQTGQGQEIAKGRLMLDTERYGLDTKKFQYQQNQPPKAPDPSKMSAYESLANIAHSLYGNDVAAKNASQAVEDTFNRGYNGDKSWTNLQDFTNAVLARNKGAADYRQLAQLAEAFYTKMAGGAGKAFG